MAGASSASSAILPLVIDPPLGLTELPHVLPRKCRGPTFGSQPTPLRARADAVVHAPLRPQGLADLADRAERTEGIAHRREKIRVAQCCVADGRQAALRILGISLGTDLRRPLELPLLPRGVDLLQLDLLILVLGIAVDAHDHALAGFDLALPVVGRLLDLVLHEAALDRVDGAPELVHSLDQRPG